MGVWEGKPKFFVWRLTGDRLRLGVVEVPMCGWRRFGPLGAQANFLHQSLARLLWLAVNPEKLISELPAGWQRSEAMQEITIKDQNLVDEISALLEICFWSSPEGFISWLHGKFFHRLAPFERQIILADLENLKLIASRPQSGPAQFSLL